MTNMATKSIYDKTFKKFLLQSQEADDFVTWYVA